MIASFRLPIRALIACIVCFVPAEVFAVQIGISPLKFEYITNLGSESSGVVKVTNKSDEAITLYSSREDFVAGDDAGTPTFVKPQDQTSEQYSLSNWITLQDSHFTLAKGETKEIAFSVKVPANAEPGGHYGAIFFSPASPDMSKSNVALVQRIGALILVNVPWDVKVDGSLSAFRVGSGLDKAFAEKTNFSSFPVTFEAVFHNSGNIHIKPEGKIEITDENGAVVTSVGKEALYSPAGAYIGERLTDYIPINDGLGNVLPNSDRRFEAVWGGIGYQVLNLDGSKTVKFKSLGEFYADKAAEKQQFLKFYESVHTRSVTKKFTASLTASYAEGKNTKEFKESRPIEVVYEEQYIGVNYMTVWIILVIVLGFGYYVIIVVPRSRERIRKELAHELASKK